MKSKMILALIVLNISALSTFAQCRKVCVGVKAGVTSSNIYAVEGKEFVADPKIGLSGGTFLSISLGENFGIQPEVLLTQKGFYASGTIDRNEYNFKRTTTHVDIPLLFQYKPIWFLSFVAGPQYSAMINKKDVFEASNITTQQTQAFINNNLRKNAVGGVTGLDIYLRRFVLSGRAGFDFQNNNGVGSATFPRYTNGWLQAMIGLRF